MTSTELLYVKMVAEKGSITQAAEMLHVSRVTLSNTIASVENDLGVKLFHRTSKGVVLSAAGEEYVLFANQVLREYDQMTSSISSLNHIEAGSVSFASSGMLYRFFLQKFLEKHNRQYPDIKMHILDPTSPMIEQKLSLCEIDMAVLHTPVDRPGLFCQHITSEALMMIAPKGHPVEKKAYFDSHSGRSYIDMKDIRNEKIALSLPAHRERRILDAIMHENRITPNIVAEFRRYETLLPYILAEQAISFTMHSFCISMYNPQAFDYYWVKGQEECFELAIIRAERLQMTRAATIVQDEIMTLIPSLLTDISAPSA